MSEDGRCVIRDGIVYGFAPAGLSSYEIPAGVTTLAEGVFASTTNLKAIILPSGLQAIERDCFNDSGIESITIPASVKSISFNVFVGCRSLRNLLGDSHFISKDRKYLYDPTRSSR